MLRYFDSYKGIVTSPIAIGEVYLSEYCFTKTYYQTLKGATVENFTESY